MLLIFRVCHKMWTEYLLSVNEFGLAINFLQSFSLRSQNGSWIDIFFLSSKRKSGISFSLSSFCLCMKIFDCAGDKTCGVTSISVFLFNGSDFLIRV